jgi:protein-disulfide isomerase
MKRLVATLVLASMGGLAVRASQAQGAPAAQPSAADQHQQILDELRAIRQLLEKLTGSPAAAPAVQVRNSQAFVLGSPDAPLTMVEFTDLECPFCREYATTGFESIKKEWIDTGRLRYLARDVPLDIHVHSLMAARAARCAGEQRYWDMRTALMKNANQLSAEYIAKTAGSLKLDLTAFNACVASTVHDGDIQADVSEAVKLGLRGTPTFVLGRTSPDAIDGVMVVGAQPYAVFDSKLKALLNSGSR